MKKLLNWLVKFFSSGKAEDAFNAAVALVPQATKVVATIAAITPNRTDDEIVALFERYAVPGAEAYLAMPREERGLAALRVASEAVARENPALAMNIVNTAVQLAYTGWRASR